MWRIVKGAALFLLMISFQVQAQNYISSPYSRYGIGDLVNSGFSYNRSLGGSSFALRPKNQINYLNPASLTAQDTLSFLLQGGFVSRRAMLETSESKDESVNGNIEYLALGFPIFKKMKASVGLVPYSRIHYNILEEEVVREGDQFTYDGNGGFNEFYFSTAFQINEWSSIGVHAGYLFGKLERKSIYRKPFTIEAATVQHSKTVASDFNFKIGAQVYPQINDDHKFIFGISYGFKSNINTKRSTVITRQYTFDSPQIIDTVRNESNVRDKFKSPRQIGIGVSYIHKDKLLLTAEYQNQDWSHLNNDGSEFDADKYSSFRFGLEYTPVSLDNKDNVSYFKRINYRVGGHLTTTYLKTTDNEPIKYNGITAGIGLPWKHPRRGYTGTKFNISYEYGVKGTTDNNLIKETYHFITVGLTLHDIWFTKPKYD